MSRVLITGANRGIGAACALAFAGIGARLALADLAAPEATATQARDAGAAEAMDLACDVADADAVSAMADRVEQAYGDLDVLVHCLRRALRASSPKWNSAGLPRWRAPRRSRW